MITGRWIPFGAVVALALPGVFLRLSGAGLGALISSKVNQRTLLIGALPVAYALSSGSLLSC